MATISIEPIEQLEKIIMGYGKSSTNTSSRGITAEEIAKIAEAVAKSLNPLLVGRQRILENVAKFTPSSIDKIARSMLLQTDKKKTNFTDLGETKEIKRDKKETDDTLAFLKGME